MNYRLIFGAVISVALLISCQYENIDLSRDVPTSSITYLMFGHTASFCLNCDAVYKIENGKLYGASNQMISNPDSAQLKLLPDSLYQKVSSLAIEVPSQLFSGSTSTIQKVGSYFPDVGHYYIEVAQNKNTYRWYIEAGNTPSYLTDFLKDVNTAMTRLR
jgi:hypothetical protein